jgi:predicted dehydrogenase
MSNPVGHVLIVSASTRMEAQVLHGVLQAAGIKPLVPDENLADGWASIQQMSNAMALGIYVPEQDASRAREALAAARAMGQSEPTEDAAPSRPLRFGVVGAGRIVSGRFVPALQHTTQAELQRVATRRPANAAHLGANHVSARYDDVFDDPEVDAVYIATHNGLHHEQALAAMRRGKHVLCEKPLGRNARECRELADVATSSGLLLVEGFMYRSHPQIALVQRLVAEGRIGTLRAVEASFSFLLTEANDVRLKPEWGGGALLDVGCYCVNFARLFLGHLPQRVAAFAEFDAQHGIDTSLSGVLDYGVGRHALVSCGFDAGLRNRALLAGTEGVITIPEAFLTVPHENVVVLDGAKGREEFRCGPADAFLVMIESFVAAARGEAAPHLAADEGWHNARIMDALLLSARRGGSPTTP